MIEWVGEDSVRVAGTLVKCAAFSDSRSEELVLSKSRELSTALLEKIAPFSGGSVLEIGVAAGGSVALIYGAIEPKRLVAVELADERVEPLDRFIRENELESVVDVYYGVDQGDQAALESIVERCFPHGIDVIIDDASHLAGPTSRSFECLFPRLVEGGLVHHRGLAVGSAGRQRARRCTHRPVRLG